MPAYQGHRSRNAWNVALWIGNDEPLYRLAIECKRKHKTIRAAADEFVAAMGGPTAKTPDGATYNITSVREALAGLES